MKFVLLFLLGLALWPSMAQAQTIDGKHEVLNCIVLDNAKDYPEYDFYAVAGLEFQTVSQQLGGQEVCAATFSSIFAVAKADDDNVNKTSQQSGVPLDWSTRPDNAQYIPNPRIEIKTMSPYVADAQPTVKKVHIYHIDGVGGECGSGCGHLVSTTSYDTNGQIVHIASTQNPLGSLLAVLAVCLGGLGLVIVTRSWKHE